jgi:hypothetical protein
MKQHTPTESVIVRKIMAKLSPLCLVRKRHGNAFGVKGDPDVYGCLPMTHPQWPGRHFEIEVKRPGEKPTPLQTTRLQAWEAAGAITGTAWNVDDALRILGFLNVPKTLMQIFAEEADEKGIYGRGLNL